MAKDDAPVHVSGQANKPLTRPAHALSPAAIVSELKSDDIDGLTAGDAAARLIEYGRNEFGSTEGVKPIRIFISQITNAMTLILILAMAVSFAIMSWVEGGVISAVILLNITVGFVQELKAAKTMDSLRALGSPSAATVRNGANIVVPTAEIVPGDLVEIKMGDTVPADIRLVEAVNFETDEALLTGESLPIRKETETTYADDTGPGDRLNIAYSSSTVTKGRARGIVFATGASTEIGQIAAALSGSDRHHRRPVKRNADGDAHPGKYVVAWTLTASDAIGRFLGVNVGTPLQRKLSQFAIILFFTAIVCALIVMAANDFSDRQQVIIYAVATGLSMIPASLVVVLTITMAAGTKRMVTRHVIVRNLKSLEALGAVTNICSDKTGTLTQGKMVVRKAWLPGHGTYSVEASDEPFNPTIGEISFSAAAPSEMQHSSTSEKSVMDGGVVPDETLLSERPVLAEYLNVASLANLATVHQSEDGDWHTRGDPTEIAIQVFASRFGRNRLSLTSAGNNDSDNNDGTTTNDSEKPMSSPAKPWRQINEFPFDSDVKRMSVIFKHTPTKVLHLFTKGAVERVLPVCTRVVLGDSSTPQPMTDSIRDSILANVGPLAQLGLRVLALASRDPVSAVDEKDAELDRAEFEQDLVFRGLIGLYDPPRLESAPSVQACHSAGISVHMLTGDHPDTARAIAIEVGILPDSHRAQPFKQSSSSSSLSVASSRAVMTASEFDKLSDDQLDALPTLPLVVARCAPNTKVRMIEALHRRQRFVAMTGDGVNDSPSLKRADVGIAMGQAGSDVAKEASDIILTDDNFASILNAVEEGRRMFDNIQKFVLHVIAVNVAQAITLLVGLAVKDASGLSVFPLAPVQIIWIIMVTSGLPDMGLGFETAAADIMQRPPQVKGIFTWELIIDTAAYGIWMAALCLSAFLVVLFGFNTGIPSDPQADCNENYSTACEPVFRARATTFACLTWFALFLAWEMISMRRSFFRSKSKKTVTADGQVVAIKKGKWPQWTLDIWSNKFLFWSIVAGFITVFPVLYIPVISEVVFKHKGISWEWGVVFVQAILFVAGIELWKWLKRAFLRRRAGKMEDVERSREART